MQGYEKCIHTCEDPPCTSDSTKSVLWRREGLSLRRHVPRAKKHTKCKPTCPGFKFLGLERVANSGVIRATREEEAEFERQVTLGIHESETTPRRVSDRRSRLLATPSTTGCLSRDSTPVSTLTDISQYNTEAIMQPPLGAPIMAFPTRTFNIVFIPDPNTVQINRLEAESDPAYVRAQISRREYDAIEHLGGSVHRRGKVNKAEGEQSVWIQEWVI